MWSYQEYAELVVKLYELTRNSNSKVQWKQSVDEGIFQSSLAGYTVKISRYRPENPEEIDDDIVVSIHDRDGHLIDWFADTDLSEFQELPPEGMTIYQTMDRLYHLARRQALGADRAVRDLLKHLNQP